MSGRRTNLALFALLVAALVSGGFAFGVGSPRGRAVVIAHGVAGLAIVLLVPWKSMVVRRGLRRGPRRGGASAIALGVVVVAAVASGVLFSTGVNLRYGPLNAIQVHVGSALVAIPFLVHHVWTRPVRLHRVDLERRNLLRAGRLDFLACASARYARLNRNRRREDRRRASDQPNQFPPARQTLAT